MDHNHDRDARLHDLDDDTIWADLPPAQQHRLQEQYSLDIAKLMLRNGKHFGALLALANAGCHFAEYCYLDNLAGWHAEGVFDHEPMRPCIGEYIRDLGEALYRAVAREKAEEGQDD